MIDVSDVLSDIPGSIKSASQPESDLTTYLLAMAVVELRGIRQELIALRESGSFPNDL